MLEEFEDAKKRIESILGADGKPRYTSLSEIGMGAISVVMKAFDNELRKHVAVKSPLESTMAFVERFKRESNALNQLDSHPNIVCAYEFYENVHSYPILVIELAKTTLQSDLKAARNRESTLGLEYLLGCVPQICDGLDGMHQRRLVHRDVKPSNILIMDDDGVKLADLGSLGFIGARKSSGPRYKTTIEYEAPELMEDWKKNHEDCRIDLYPVGLIMYEILTGRDLIPGLDAEYSSDNAWREHVLGEKKKYDSIGQRISVLKVSEHIREAIRRCTCPIDQRYRSALELKAALLGEERKAATPSPRTDPALEQLRQQTWGAYAELTQRVGQIKGKDWVPVPAERSGIFRLDAQPCQKVLGGINYALQHALQHRNPDSADTTQLGGVVATLKEYMDYAHNQGI